MILHTVNTSPTQSNSLISCLRVAATNSSILLFEDGVYGAIDNIQTMNIWKNIPTNTLINNAINNDKENQVEASPLQYTTDKNSPLISVNCFVLKEDLEARGLTQKVIEFFTVVDYDGFVDLSLEHHTVQSWF